MGAIKEEGGGERGREWRACDTPTNADGGGAYGSRRKR